MSYKNDDRIRRKAYNVDNPVCNAGLRIYSIYRQLRMELNYYVVRVAWIFRFYPELRYACKGLSKFKIYGLVFDKTVRQNRFF